MAITLNNAATCRRSLSLMGRCAAFAIVIPLLAACAGQEAIPEDRFYRVQVAPPAKPLSKPLLQGTLEVERMVADGLIAGRPIIYSDETAPNEVKEYHYDFWTEPPVALFMDQLVKYLRVLNIADMVVSGDYRATVDYAVAGKILRLEQVNGEKPGASVEIELALLRRSDNKVLYLNTYSENVAAEGEDVGSAIAAMNTALSRIYHRFAVDLQKKR